MRRSEYLKFVEEESHHKKTRIVKVRSERSDAYLGTIRWYGPWRQYVFYPATESLFNNGCLDEISKRLCSMNAQHREKLRMEKVNGV